MREISTTVNKSYAIWHVFTFLDKSSDSKGTRLGHQVSRVFVHNFVCLCLLTKDILKYKDMLSNDYLNCRNTAWLNSFFSMLTLKIRFYRDDIISVDKTGQQNIPVHAELRDTHTHTLPHSSICLWDVCSLIMLIWILSKKIKNQYLHHKMLLKHRSACIVLVFFSFFFAHVWQTCPQMQKMWQLL